MSNTTTETLHPHQVSLVLDTREVAIALGPDAPLVYTAAGRTPIRPTSLRVTYSIPAGTFYGVTLCGELTDERDRRKAAKPRMRHSGEWYDEVPIRERRLRAADLPPWLAAIVEQHQPCYIEREA